MILDYSDAQTIGFKVVLVHKIVYSNPAINANHIYNMESLTESERIMLMKNIISIFIKYSLVVSVDVNFIQANKAAVQKLDTTDQVIY